MGKETLGDILNQAKLASRIQVANKHMAKPGPNDIYIGRGSPLGNPHRIGEGMPRDLAIAFYKDWLDDKVRRQDPVVLDALGDIADRVLRGEQVRLMCFCAPKPCHGEVIKRLVCNAITDHAAEQALTQSAA